MQKPKVIFANMVNELMTAQPGPLHAKGLNSVSPRKIWLASEGDCVILPRPMDDQYKVYACATLGIDPHKVATISPEGGDFDFLANRLMADTNAWQQLEDYFSAGEAPEFLSFAQDAPTWALLERLGLKHVWYDDFPGSDTRQMIYDINTKHGFREVAKNLGFNVAPGGRYQGLEGVLKGVRKHVSVTGKVILKFNRSSNGYGNLLFDEEDVNLERVEARLQPFSEQPLDFVVEAFLDFVSLPSAEIAVGPTGPRNLYNCGQRCENNAWIGMITPPVDLSQAKLDELDRIGLTFGEYVYARGFRGVCDVDAGVTAEGEIYVSESNFRRTGGTYLDTLVRRLVGDDYLSRYFWTADTLLGRTDVEFDDALDLLDAEGLLFDAEVEKCGVVLTVDTNKIDGKWRYLAIDWDLERLKQTESKSAQILKLELPHAP